MAYARSKRLSASAVPVIDIGPLRDGTDIEAVAEKLGWAATEVGFIYIENHGIGAKVIEGARRVALQFFNLPLEQKLEAASNVHHHGYIRPGGSKMYDDARADLKESFNWGLELGEADLEAAADNPLLGPNRWPPSLPELRRAVHPYFEAASSCAIDLLRGFAITAGRDPAFFVQHADRPISRGSLQYYPPQPADAEETQFGVAPHTDFGVLTVLSQDEIGGLELRDLEGEWLAVPPIPDTLVVNVGDLLERWSNGRFRSTPHRVINSSGRERLSLVLAYDPNYETVVDPSDLCAHRETLRHDPITCGEYLVWRFGKAFAYRQ